MAASTAPIAPVVMSELSRIVASSLIVMFQGCIL
jgi:hypothetical protein